jgi:hypothetical protein
VIDQLEQIQMLSLVNRVGGDRHSRSALMVERPRRGRKDDHRQRNNPREPKCKAISFLCHVSPRGPGSMLRMLGGGIGREPKGRAAA